MMVALPYHFLKVCGGYVFAAQGSDIHSFNSTLEHVSTWRYPVKQAEEKNGQSAESQDSPAPEGPPTKRRKVADGQEPNSNAEPQDPPNGSKKSKKAAQYENAVNERPFVQGLYATTDGRHLVATTGSDKTIWVFEHDGAGNLKQLSQRVMPKRPCALALTSDNRTILSADKFGDVYALPLLPSPTTAVSTETASSSLASHPAAAISAPHSRSATPSTPGAPVTLKPQANEFTVHTRRNLKALENQKISLELKAARQQEQQDQQQQRPSFEHTLLLGHVSMLTAICVGTATVNTTTTLSNSSSGGGDAATTGGEKEVQGRRRREYIITADRDEHIRVSRGMPQAHVIEGFCLGHEDFVSRLCMAPGGRERVLISAGGDDDLFVWDWVKGDLLGRAGVLEHVKGVVGEDVNKVAVTRVFACQWEGVTAVFVVAERVPAFFHYELLEDNSLKYHETIQLPGNPLDVELVGAPGAAQRLLVAVDTSASVEGSNSSLVVLSKEQAGWQQGRVQNLPAAGEVTISTEELQRILYSTESLRKLSDFD